jgi:ectoine utilization protein EutC
LNDTMPITILTESELRQCVALDGEAIAAVEEAFVALAEGRAVTPPIMRIDIAAHHGEVDVKSAYVEGLDSFAIKVASGFFDNPKRGLPSGSGLMLLWSATVGFPQAALFDNGYLTHVRTGAAGAIAAKYLARQQIETVGVIGSGTQARYQVLTLREVRDFSRVLVYSPNADHLTRYVAEMEEALGLPVEAADGAEAVVRGCDLLVTTTPSTQPIVRAEWLHPGLHITAMGSDAEQKQELEPDVLAAADRLVCDLKSQCFRLGEHHHALEAGLLTADAQVDELGEIAAGRKPGRTSESEITLCDLTGVGIQDTAIALLAYQKASALGLGMQLET